MNKADKIKIIKIVDENKAIINEANRRLNEVRRSKWKSTPATDMVKSTLKKYGTKKGLFRKRFENTEEGEKDYARTLSEAKRYLKADTSTVEGYERVLNEREQRFRDRYGADWGQTDLQRKQFFKAISSKWYHRLHDLGVSSEELIRYATMFSEKTKSKDPKAVEKAMQRLYEGTFFREEDPATYARMLMNRRTKKMTAGRAGSVFELYTKAWYDGDFEEFDPEEYDF